MRRNVVIAVTLMALYTYTVVFLCVAPWLGWRHGAGPWVIGGFFAVGVPFLVCYIITAATDAGRAH